MELLNVADKVSGTEEASVIIEHERGALFFQNCADAPGAEFAGQWFPDESEHDGQFVHRHMLCLAKYFSSQQNLPTMMAHFQNSRGLNFKRRAKRKLPSPLA